MPSIRRTAWRPQNYNRKNAQFGFNLIYDFSRTTLDGERELVLRANAGCRRHRDESEYDRFDNFNHLKAGLRDMTALAQLI